MSTVRIHDCKQLNTDFDYPFKDDYYGITEMFEQDYDSLCFSVVENELGLEYLHKANVLNEQINDYHVKELGKSIGVDIVIHGFAYIFEVPLKYLEPTKASAGRDKNYGGVYRNNILELFNARAENIKKTEAITETGTYVNITYYELNINTGEKTFIFKNRTMLKIG